MTILYLLGFPTPVVELVLGGIVLFLVTSVYFGLRFTGLDEVDEDRDRTKPGGRRATGVEEPES